MMSGGDRLSSLPDDLLRRVLHFAPAREAESTSALSKRWRGLWCSTGAVKLDERIPETKDEDDALFFSRRDAFVSAARLSLEAAAAPAVTRLTFREEAAGHDNYTVYKFLRLESNNWRSRGTDVVEELLSLQAARRVEELRLAPVYSGHTMTMSSDREVTSKDDYFSTLKFISLPSETLRVLDISSCRCEYLTPPASVAFPRLASLRLSLCSVWTEHLQDFIHAAPALATIHLESVMFYRANPHKKPPPLQEGLTIRLHCPAATALLLDKCCWAEKPYDGSSGTTSMEIDAPRLRRFKHARHNLVTFWQLLHNFCNAKELKLRVNLLEAIAVVGTASRAELLCSFHKLERLELEGRLAQNEKAAAVSIANVLQCCPVLRDLRINLTTPMPIWTLESTRRDASWRRNIDTISTSPSMISTTAHQ
ncbi:unnamed protein product [Alopecurus aequalis]